MARTKKHNVWLTKHLREGIICENKNKHSINWIENLGKK